MGPDLREGSFKDADLTAANFSAAKLVKADIVAAKLSRADFSGASLQRATLTMLRDAATLACLQVAASILNDKSDTTEISLIYANQHDSRLKTAAP